ncbi:alpha/beta fold hydrolase [Mesorhizobium sp. NBSH29]|uniref:alpha/beta hydrolase n=1 Tax=Mesorhizobium sp. NBSH29 TaxID=2654249 RepID=UPI0018969C40|nr:alpha/beta hydrolase [Mesorhizobium sp. NBSH29]QPC85743.1 alpha/beta fold hydrolase [Mesorhizobium sp. NBSH29]
MIEHSIMDWDNAYANGANIPGGDRWPDLWVKPARLFRETLVDDGRARLDIEYGTGARNRLDLFLPTSAPLGLVVFVHGGFWKALDKSFWSHLAAGSLANGYAVAMPSYTLCPDARIADITKEIGTAVTRVAEMVEGPIMLTGHSAGGHLVSRLVSQTTPLADTLKRRVRNTVSISGVHDLRPLMKTALNKDLRIDEAEAAAESPALLHPMEDARITCWVGSSERSEFVRQNALLANIWTGLGASTSTVVEPDRHHFDVIDGLANADHPLTRNLLGLHASR